MPYAPNAYAVIMAGGRGERFWPMSRAARPKQFIDLFGGKALLQLAVERLEGLVPPERILIVTSRDLVTASREAAPSLPSGNVVGEPCARDTAAACALGTALVAARQGGDSATLAILTADQLMEDLAVFRQTLRDAFALAAKEPMIVTIGITPTSPATGFGYIEADERLAFDGPTLFHKVRRFVEKPNAETAAAYVAGGKHFWNAGMFVWSVPTFRDALRRSRPALADAMDRVAPSIGTDDFDAALERTYASLDRISIDYAVMEHADNIAMARGTFGWDDVGSWTAIANHFPEDADGNVAVGTCELQDARGNIVLSDPRHLVAVYGANDLVVVHTPDATLVCPRDKVQNLKELVRRVGARADGAKYV
jgi:mannose-1-phosphate guanylyltransferase